MYFNKTFYDENNNVIEIEIICNKCGNILHITDISKFNYIQNEYCIVKNDNFIQCTCGNLDTGEINYKQNPNINNLIKKEPLNQANLNKPKCPTCNSTNVKKISSTAKIAGAVTFGLFSKTAKSQFCCKNCGYKW